MATPGMEEVEEILDPAIDVPAEFELELTDLLPRKYLSVSQMTTFLKCPQQWYLRYIEQKSSKPSARMFQGIQVHSAVEAILSAKLATGTLPPVALGYDTYSTAFDEHKPLIEDWEGEDPGKVKDVGIECTKQFYQEAAPTAMPVMVEKAFHTVIRSNDGKISLPVLGRIDSIQVQALNDDDYQGMRETAVADVKAQTDKGSTVPDLPKVKKPLRIHDLKVVTDKWGGDDLNNDLQFHLYAGVEHIPDVQVDMLVKGRAKVPRPRYEVMNGVISPQMVKHAVRVTEGVAKSIGMGHFPPTDPSNWWCGEKWCSMWFHCRGKK